MTGARALCQTIQTQVQARELALLRVQVAEGQAEVALEEDIDAAAVASTGTEGTGGDTLADQAERVAELQRLVGQLPEKEERLSALKRDLDRAAELDLPAREQRLLDMFEAVTGVLTKLESWGVADLAQGCDQLQKEVDDAYGMLIECRGGRHTKSWYWHWLRFHLVWGARLLQRRWPELKLQHFSNQVGIFNSVRIYVLSVPGTVWLGPGCAPCPRRPRGVGIVVNNNFFERG